MVMYTHGAFTTNFLMYKLHVVCQTREDVPHDHSPGQGLSLAGFPFQREDGVSDTKRKFHPDLPIFNLRQ